jgi:predicted transcriptional regulator
MRRKSSTLTTQELEIMKAIWSRGRATVRDVHDALRERRAVDSTPPRKVRAAGTPAYTTVQTMMNILETKGHLKKEPGDKAQVYVPVRPQQAVVKSMVREFVDRVFDGSARPLLVHLLNDKGLSERERKELQRLLDKSEEP